MVNKFIEEQLVKIGYTNLWLEYNILTIESLNEQVENYNNGYDKNKEHYRYATLNFFLNNNLQLTEKQLSNYLDITLNDEDKSMASSAIIDVFQKIELSENEFIQVCDTLKNFGNWTEKIIERHKLLRELKSETFSDDLFEKAVMFKDSIIHDILLKKSNLVQLEKLTVLGVNKSIRNQATQKIKQIKNSI